MSLPGHSRNLCSKTSDKTFLPLQAGLLARSEMCCVAWKQHSLSIGVRRTDFLQRAKQSDVNWFCLPPSHCVVSLSIIIVPSEFSEVVKLSDGSSFTLVKNCTQTVYVSSACWPPLICYAVILLQSYTIQRIDQFCSWVEVWLIDDKIDLTSTLASTMSPKI